MILFLLLLVFTLPVNAQQNRDHCKKTAALAEMFRNYHYDPHPMDDVFSERIYDNFLEMLDRDSWYFSKQQRNELEEYRDKLDDEILSGNCEFIVKITDMFRQRLELTDSLIDIMLANPFGFKENDTITFFADSENQEFYDETGIRDKWAKWLKYNIIYEMFSSFEHSDSLRVADIKKLLEQEPEKRAKILKDEKRTIQNLLNHPMGFDEYISTLFLSTMATCYDPHSDYFTMNGKENFEKGVSKEALSYGIEVEPDKNGNTCISKLSPGGPAWKSNELHKGDILMKVAFDDQKSYDLEGMGIYEVTMIISSAESDRMELSVKKPNGQVKTVLLIKAKIEVDENVIKSYQLKGSCNVGYIALPGFYTEMENENALGCANDVAKEIIKLQREKIDGLILDLRYNGGGSMKEALDLAGIFIDEGPICVLASRSAKPMSLKDMNRGTIYDGPLIVLVNGMSASASEIMATALRDYNRALIVGTNTYGKASGQIILPLDPNVTPESTYETMYDNSAGFIKITIDKFYRITGSTHQLYGLKPDIYLPNPFEDKEYHESFEKHPLSADSIVKKVYYTPYPEININQLADSSLNRINNDSVFQKIKIVAKSYAANEKKIIKIPLKMESYKNFIIDQLKKREDSEQLIVRKSTDFNVVNHSDDVEINRMDIYRNEINNAQLENISEDIFIGETYQIMKDFIKFGQTKK